MDTVPKERGTFSNHIFNYWICSFLNPLQKCSTHLSPIVLASLYLKVCTHIKVLPPTILHHIYHANSKHKHTEGKIFHRLKEGRVKHTHTHTLVFCTPRICNSAANHKMQQKINKKKTRPPHHDYTLGRIIR